MRSKKTNKQNDDKKPKAAKGYFVLFIGDDGAVLVYYQGGQVLRRLFANAHDDKSAPALVELLGEYPKSIIYVLVDLLDQAYVRHTLPPVTALGVNKIIQRRLSRDFAATDLKGAISLGREKNGRKDWNFLLISLAYNSRLKGWLDLIYDLPNRLMGIYLAPVEAEMVLHSLKNATNGGRKSLKNRKKQTDEAKPPQWDILVLHNKTGGFRQVVLKDNKLVFTRMAQCAPNEKPSVMAGNVEQEIKNTIEYLKRLAFSQGSELHIIIVIAEEIKANISTNVFNAKSCIVHTPHEAGELLKIGKAVLSGDKFTDIFLSCAFLQYKKHRLKLMSETIKKTERLYNVINYTKIAAGIAVAGLIGLAAYDGYVSYNLSLEIAKQQSQIKSVSNRAQDFAEKTAKFETDPQKIDALVKINDLISVKTTDYDALIMGIAENASDYAHVKNFEWTATNPTTNMAKPSINASAAPTPTTDNFEAKIEWELTVKSGEEKQAKIIWQSLQQDLQTTFKAYQIIDEGVEGMGEGEDKLTVNFTEKANSATSQPMERKLIAKMKIIPALKTPTPETSTTAINQ